MRLAGCLQRNRRHLVVFSHKASLSNMVHLDSYLWSCIFLVFSPTKNRPLHEGEVVPKFSCLGLSQRKAAQYFYYMTLTVYARVVTGGDGVGGSLFFLRNINCCWFQMSI